MTPETARLLASAKEWWNKLTPEQQRAHLREQRINWAYTEYCWQVEEQGRKPTMTREQIAEMIDRKDAEST
jgi:hypothetical protein